MNNEPENIKPFNEYDLKEVEVDSFVYDGFTVARSEFFAKTKAPAVTITYGEVYFNHAAISRWADVTYIQILINKDDRKMAIRPCQEDDKDAIQWCRTDKNGKRVVKHIGARFFAAKLYDDFKWNTNCQIKMIATLVKAKDEQLYLFDLTAIGIYVMQVVEGLHSPRRIRVPYFPQSWQGDYGDPVEEHAKTLTRIENLPDGFVVLKQTPPKSKRAANAPPEENITEEVVKNGESD
ncbi:hypothetical protein FACS1894211_06520 [Clostridia bacterium]|nr:hypothetical protein FACS1894211_06520 [Clostridia bacterium]